MFLQLARILALGAYVVNAIMLLLSVSAAWINPKYFWPPAFVKLFFLGWVIVLLAFLLSFILLRLKILSWISITLLILCLPSFFKLYGFHPLKQNQLPEKHLRVMTYNVESFDWLNKKDGAAGVLKNIRNANADIICMQEYFMYRNDKLKIMDSLKNNYGYRYFHEYVLSKVSKNAVFGMAVFSRYPISELNNIPFGNSITNGGCYVDLYRGRDTFRILNIHFQSFSLSQLEIEGEYPHSNVHVSRWKLFKISLVKFRKGFRKKSFQTQEVEQAITNSPYPVILCGDFNDTPLSFTYARLTDRLEDTFLKTNSGLGTTFAGSLPYLRIDYILSDKKLKPARTQVIEKKASDHYPLVCDFAINP